MKFDQLIHIYWSKGFFYNKKLKTFNQTLNLFCKDIYHFNIYNSNKFVKRFELTYFKYNSNFTFLKLNLNMRKTINMYLSKIFNINFYFTDLIKYNLIRLYLIKSFRGRASFIEKPSRGQKTRSNSRTVKKLNNFLKKFVNDIKKKFKIGEVVALKNKKLLQKKKKKKIFKIKYVVKKNINWF